MPHMKLSSLLHPVKNHPRLRAPGIYRIPCECIWVYIGQTGTSTDIMLKEHPDKSVVAEPSINHRHAFNSHNFSILAMKTRHMDRTVREAIETELHPYNINREGGFCLSKSWNPLIGSLYIFGTSPRYTWRRNALC
jgi:hypothetical protein